MKRFSPPGQCPVCGEWVYRGQVACSECGACERSGWRAEAAYDGLDLPDEADEVFDYDAFVEKEFGSAGERRIGEGRWGRLWWWVAVALLVAFGAALLMNVF